MYLFSGNGMSAKVAGWLGDDLEGGFVFPVYGWRLPKLVRRELAAGKGDAEKAAPYRWAVFTCGDDAGFIDRDLERTLGVKLDAAFTVVMPDTYLGLPGFRLDSPEERDAKLAAAQKRCAQIREKILRRERVREMKRGVFARLKTNLIGRFFERFLENDRAWRVDAAKCLRCGKCAAECPAGAIASEGGLPRWKRDGSCTNCFRCYHRCPAGAIRCAFTGAKGRVT